MANIDTTAALLQLINVLTKLTERVGIPTSASKQNPLIISPSTDEDRAKIWGETLEIGKFSKSTDKAISSTLTNNPFGILGINSEQLVKLSTDLEVAIPGLIAFKNLDWELLEIATDYLNEFLLDLNLMEDKANKAVTVTETLKLVGANLSQIGVVNAAATTTSWTILAAAMIPIGLVMAALAFIAPFTPAIETGLLVVESVLGAFLIDAVLGAVVIAGIGVALYVFAKGFSAIADSFAKFAGIDWGTIGKASLVLGGLIAATIGLGVPAVALLAGLGVVVMLGIAGGLAVLGKAFEYIATLNISQLPEIGANIGLFLRNLVSGGEGGITGFFTDLVAGGKIAALGPVLMAVGAGIGALAVAINLLLPNTDKFTGFINNFINIDVIKIKSVSDQLTTSFENVSKSIHNIGEAIDQVSFSKLALLATNLGKVAISVNAFSPEMTKTNAILTDQLTIQKQQLVELQNHSVLLKNLQITPSNNNTPPTNNNINPFQNTRDKYRTSPYHTK